MRAPFFAGSLVVLASLAGCNSTGQLKLSSERELGFAEVQAIQPGLSASQILDAYGQPVGLSRRACGTIERIDYKATDARGGKNHLLLDFDAQERLVRKTFTGAILRP